jgi:hypothetical protein
MHIFGLKKMWLEIAAVFALFLALYMIWDNHQEGNK